MMRKIAIVLAGGRGSRMKSSVPKQYLLLNDKPVLYYSLKMFQESDVDDIILISGQEEIEFCQKEIAEKYHFNKIVNIIEGGAERYDSVYNGLRAAKELCGGSDNLKNVYILIHDGARPCVDKNIFDNCMEAVREFGACTAAVPVKDTIKVVDKDGFAIETPERSSLWQIQTPQAFRFDIIAQAYQKMYQDTQKGTITDDAMLVEKYTDIKVKMAIGSYNNIKITTPEDMGMALQIINGKCG